MFIRNKFFKNNKLIKNKFFLLSITSIMILLISFISDYYFFEIIKNINLLKEENFFINNINKEIKIISYLSIVLSVFTFLIAVLNVEQFFKTLKIKNRIYIDELSGLNNRNYLENYLNKKIKSKNFISIMCDIDHFKNINDTYGHDIGDKVISYIGEMIKTSIRENIDYAIRYGGEEFLIFINTSLNEYNEEIIYDIFERLHTKIKNKIFIANNKEFSITLSFGINCDINNNDTIYQNIKKADMALYHAKKERNLIILYTEKNKNDFGLSYEEILKFILEKKFYPEYFPISKSYINNKNIDLYDTNLQFKVNDKIYYKELFEDVLNNDITLLEKWTVFGLNYIIENNFKNEEKVFSINTKQLFNQNIFNELIDNNNNNKIILNITILHKEYKLLINKLNILKNNFKISISDKLNKEILMILLEKMKIDFIYTENNNIDYLKFLNKIALEYNFNLIILKNINKENIEELNNIKPIFFKKNLKECNEK